MLSRKFIVTILLIAIATSLLILNTISEDAWIYVISLVSSSYLGANVLTHISIKKKK